MAPNSPRQRSFASQQVGTLALSHVLVDNPMAPVRAATWMNTLRGIGIHLPFFVVHDLGILFSMQQGGGEAMISPRKKSLARLNLGPSVGLCLEKYQSLLENIAESEVVHKIVNWRLRDDMIAVLLARVLGDVYNRWKEPAKAVGAENMPLELSFYDGANHAEIMEEFSIDPLLEFCAHLVEHSMHIYTRVELIDIDTVKLLGMFRENEGEAMGQAIDLVDLFATLGSAEANDVANFSLDLMPSILETKRAAGGQRFAVNGYASIERRGSVDSLVMSQLAYDDEIFEQKVIDSELYYFAHEAQKEEQRRLQYILVDSSASMRGKRQVFARGLALALAKKFTLEGDDVWVRFFDSRLHDIMRFSNGSSNSVPYLLSFRSERGRNYGKVFRSFMIELSQLVHENRRQVIVYLITHGQCHIPSELVAKMAAEAFLYGIIILPSSAISLEFLPLMQRHQIVESHDLASRDDRKDKALGIVSDTNRGRQERRGLVG